MHITPSQLTDLAYDLVEIGVHAKDSQDLENKVTRYLENFEADHQEYTESWNNLLVLGANIN